MTRILNERLCQQTLTYLRSSSSTIFETELNMSSKSITPPHRYLLQPESRRGAAGIFGIILCVALFTVLAVISEFAYINTARTELSRSADSAALAGAWALHDARVSGDLDGVGQVRSSAGMISSANHIGTIEAHVGSVDHGVEIGSYNHSTRVFEPKNDWASANAVRINLHLTESAHGELPLQLAGLTGRKTQSLQQSVTAAFRHNISGFKRPPNDATKVDILPIALDEETWQQVSAKQTSDDLMYFNGSVIEGSDGFYECSLYPTGTGSPGNRGTVDIGSSNNSTSDLRRQILHGISQDDFDALGRELVFDEYGELTLNGDTGISAGIKAELSSIIGEKRIIPIFRRVQGNGNNANYTIIRWEGVRILSVQLTGPMRKKHLTIQPTPMIARGCEFAATETVHSEYLYSPAMLVD